MKSIYLTIDDSPSNDTDSLVDFLSAHHIPSLLFARGALMEETQGFNRIVRAIQAGCIIANHSYAHERTSEIGFKSQTDQILKTQILIDRAYDIAEVKKPMQYMRFPHLDRGCGNAWVIDFDTVPEPYRAHVQSLFWDGVRLETKEKPTPAMIHLKNDMQKWLIDNGFQRFAPPDITLPWWQESELATAVDMLMTYSTSDWMVTPRHRGKWPYKTVDDLCRKIDDDVYLSSFPSSHIVLMHDDREESLTSTRKLVKHFLNQGFRFLSF